MDNNFTIVMRRDLLDMGLLRTADSSLPRVIRYMNTCIPFVGMLDGAVVASCLVEARENCHDIVNLAVSSEVQGKGYGREILSHVLSYLKENGCRYVEIGCGNAELHLYAMFQRVGFRVVGVWPDHLLEDTGAAGVVNSIVNRDTVRFRADLHERTLATTGYDASGRT